MVRKERKTSGNSIARAVFVAVSLLFQIGWLMLLILELNEYSTRISLLTTVLSVVVVLRLNSKHTNSAMKMPWIMLILAFPVMGLCMYLLFEMLGDPGVGKRLRTVRERMKDAIPHNTEDVLTNLEMRDLSAANQFRYVWKGRRWPVYENTRVDYFAESVDAHKVMKEELEKARKFIFVEYFIVEDSSSCRELEEILVR